MRQCFRIARPEKESRKQNWQRSEVMQVSVKKSAQTHDRAIISAPSRPFKGDLPNAASRESTRLSTLKHDDAADGLAALQGSEAVIDLIEPDVARDQLVELEGAVEIGASEEREVARRPRPAIARPPDALFAHEAPPAERDILRDIGLAEPDHLAARAHRFEAGAKRSRAAGGFEHDIGAASGGLRLGDGARVLAARIDAGGRTDSLGEREFRRVEIDRDDLARPGEPRALHGGEPDRAAADDHDRVAKADRRDVERGADPGHHA